MEQISITAAQYGENNGSIIAIIDGKQYAVPLDPANCHYAEILRQVEAGSLTIQAAQE